MQWELFREHFTKPTSDIVYVLMSPCRDIARVNSLSHCGEAVSTLQAGAA